MISATGPAQELDADGREREYFVVSMTPRADSFENKAPRKGGD